MIVMMRILLTLLEIARKFLFHILVDESINNA